MNPRTVHYYYSRRSKRGNSAIIDSLPDDLLLEILVRVSAEDIDENARLVCRKWKRIIHGDGFVYAHLHHTRSELLIVKFPERGSHLTFVAAAESGIQISELRCKFNFPVLASCNGLILGKDRFGLHSDTNRFIVNPATKHRFDLPQFLSLDKGLGLFGLAYAAATMEYKVVASWCDFVSFAVAKCVILTLGVDKTWRQVPIEQLHFRYKWLPLQTPIITEGYLHWARCDDVLSMNVETEVITETRAPLLPQDYQGKGFSYLSAGEYLSLLISCGDNSLWEIWEMKPETREWRKLVNKIDLRSHKCKTGEFSCEFIFPVAWVKYPDVLAFFGNGKGVSCIFYNLETDPFQSSDLDCIHSVVVHRNSLAWFR